MNEKREVFITREYTKGTERLMVLVATVTGGDITGTMYQFEEWHNNQEREEARLASGNRYEVRKKFVNRIMTLDEDGWKKMGGLSGGREDQRFFDLSGL
ncbi:MAG: hypothetical protein WBG54_16020 [Acidobacteriaceae bacterium]